MIADKVQGSHSLSCGTVCHRTGVQPLEPKGLSWDYGIGVSAGSTELPKDVHANVCGLTEKGKCHPAQLASTEKLGCTCRKWTLSFRFRFPFEAIIEGCAVIAGKLFAFDKYSF